MDFKNSFVIGSGQMGSGIAQVLATSGVAVTLYDSNTNQLDKAINNVDKSLDKFVEKEILSEEEKKQIRARISTLSEMPKKLETDICIEAIPENIKLKKELFFDLSEICDDNTVLATNTSSLSITEIASVVRKPENVIGMHFMNPVPLMPLVEIIRGLQTEDTVYNRVVKLVQSIDKTPITANRDYPGFIVNRILVPMLNEAFYVLMEGIASPEDIDNAMKLGTNQPMGPLALADFVGLDTCLFICETFHRELGEDKYRPCPLLRKYVEAGWLGKKTGRGVYSY